MNVCVNMVLTDGTLCWKKLDIPDMLIYPANWSAIRLPKDLPVVTGLKPEDTSVKYRIDLGNQNNAIMDLDEDGNYTLIVRKQEEVPEQFKNQLIKQGWEMGFHCAPTCRLLP